MAQSSALLEIKNAGMVYESERSETIPAITDINLKIEKGEFICILGPSGCGKSTLLKIIAGYQFPSNGEVFYDGVKVTGPSWDRGVVFQSPTLYPWLSVKENVGFGPKVRGLNKDIIEKTSLRLLQEVGLEEHRDKAVFELSGGMKQRVALARILANQPQTILMDEPLGALDALTRLNMQGLIRDLWQQTKNTIIMITHDVDEALSLGTRLLVMSPQPGTIEKSYEIDFTYSAQSKNNHRVKVGAEYLSLKDEILDIINIAAQKELNKA